MVPPNSEQVESSPLALHYRTAYEGVATLLRVLIALTAMHSIARLLCCLVYRWQTLIGYAWW